MKYIIQLLSISSALVIGAGVAEASRQQGAATPPKTAQQVPAQPVDQVGQAVPPVAEVPAEPGLFDQISGVLGKTAAEAVGAAGSLVGATKEEKAAILKQQGSQTAGSGVSGLGQVAAGKAGTGAVGQIASSAAQSAGTAASKVAAGKPDTGGYAPSAGATDTSSVQAPSAAAPVAGEPHD